jgi:hypothetical protein
LGAFEVVERLATLAVVLARGSDSRSIQPREPRWR